MFENTENEKGAIVGSSLNTMISTRLYLIMFNCLMLKDSPSNDLAKLWYSNKWALTYQWEMLLSDETWNQNTYLGGN